MHISVLLENLLHTTTVFPIQVKSYKELCSLLNLKPHSNAEFRKAQLQELENYCRISRKGNSYYIEEIYTEPSIELKFDGKAKTQELLVYTLLDYLFLQNTKEDSSELPYGDIVRTYVSRKELSYKLGLCEEVFQEKKRNIYPSAAGMTKQYVKDEKFKEDGVKSMSDFVEQFFKLNNKTFNDMLESVVNYIQRHRIKCLLIVIKLMQTLPVKLIQELSHIYYPVLILLLKIKAVSFSVRLKNFHPDIS